MFIFCAVGQQSSFRDCLLQNKLHIRQKIPTNKWIFVCWIILGYRYTAPRNVPPRYIPPRNVPAGKNRIFFRFVAALFRFVAHFARVRIEDSSRSRFVSTAYFAQSQTTLFPCILFLGVSVREGISSGGK